MAEIALDAVEVGVGGEDEAVGIQKIQEAAFFFLGGDRCFGGFEGGEVGEGFVDETEGLAARSP